MASQPIMSETKKPGKAVAKVAPRKHTVLSDGRRNNGGARPGAGKPPWSPKPKQIEAANQKGVYRLQTAEEAMEDARSLVRHYVAISYPPEVIARLMNPPMHDDTLRKHFAFELENGALIQNAKVAGTGYALAVSGRDAAMTRWWMAVRGGWKLDDPAGAGGPIPIQSIPGDEGL